LSVLTALGTPAIAQQSASYRLKESVLNSGSHPAQGTVLSSPSFKLKIDSVGEGLIRMALSSSSYHLDAGFVGAYLPSGEVNWLGFINKTVLRWNPEKSVGVYNVYREPISSLPGAFGTCLARGLQVTNYNEPTVPLSGTGYYYLITAENRLGEEGTKGFRSSGTERSNAFASP
jgi:hypothetical protein